MTLKQYQNLSKGSKEISWVAELQQILYHVAAVIQKASLMGKNVKLT